MIGWHLLGTDQNLPSLLLLLRVVHSPPGTHGWNMLKEVNINGVGYWIRLKTTTSSSQVSNAKIPIGLKIPLNRHHISYYKQYSIHRISCSDLKLCQWNDGLIGLVPLMRTVSLVNQWFNGWCCKLLINIAFNGWMWIFIVDNCRYADMDIDDI